MPPVGTSGAAAGVSGASQGEVGVDVAVGVLHLLNQGDPVGQLLLQLLPLGHHLGVGVIVDDGQGIGDGLNALVDVGVLEHIALELVIGLAVELGNGVDEVGLAAGGLLNLIDGLVQGVDGIDLLLGVPEVVGELHVLKGDGAVGHGSDHGLVDGDTGHSLQLLVAGHHGALDLKGGAHLVLGVQSGVHLFPGHGNQGGVELLGEVVAGGAVQVGGGVVKGDAVGHHGLGQDGSTARLGGGDILVQALDAVHLHLQGVGAGDSLALLLAGHGDLQGAVAAVLGCQLHLRLIGGAHNLHVLAALGELPLVAQAVQPCGEALGGECTRLALEDALLTGDLGGNQLVPLGGHLLAVHFPFADAHAVGAGPVAVNLQANLGGLHRLLEGDHIPIAVVAVEVVAGLVGGGLGAAVLHAHGGHDLAGLIGHVGDLLPLAGLVVEVLHFTALGEGHVAGGGEVAVIRPVHHPHAVEHIGGIPGQGDGGGIGAAVPGVPGGARVGGQLAVVDVGHRGVLGIRGGGSLEGHIVPVGLGQLGAVHFHLTDAHAGLAVAVAVDDQTQLAGLNGLVHGHAIPVAVGPVGKLAGIGARLIGGAELHANGGGVSAGLVHQLGDIHPLLGALIVPLELAGGGELHPVVVRPPHDPHAGDVIGGVTPVQIHGDGVLHVASLGPGVPGGPVAVCQGAVIDGGLGVVGQGGVGVGGGHRGLSGHVGAGGDGLIAKGLPLADAHTVGAAAVALDLHQQLGGGNGFSKFHIVPILVVAVDAVVGAGIHFHTHFVGGHALLIGHPGDGLLVALAVHIVQGGGLGEGDVGVGVDGGIIRPPDHPHACDHLLGLPSQGGGDGIGAVIGAPAVPAAVGVGSGQCSVVHSIGRDAPNIGVGGACGGLEGNVVAQILTVCLHVVVQLAAVVLSLSSGRTHGNHGQHHGRTEQACCNAFVSKLLETFHGFSSLFVMFCGSLPRLIPWLTSSPAPPGTPTPSFRQTGYMSALIQPHGSIHLLENQQLAHRFDIFHLSNNTNYTI